MTKTFEEVKELFESNWFTVTIDMTNVENYINSQEWRNKWIYKCLYDSVKPFLKEAQYFLLEKDWQVADLTYGSCAGGSVRIRSINGMGPWLISRYEFNKENHDLFIKIWKENDLWTKVAYVMLKDKELEDYLNNNEEYLNESIINREETNLLDLEWFKNLEDYYATLDQWQRRKFRLAEREFVWNNYTVEVIDSTNSTNEEIKEMIEKSMELNIKSFDEKEESLSWKSMFRDMAWKTSPWKEWVFAMDLSKQWVVVVKNQEWQIISSLFFYNDLENKYSLFVNSWYDKNLSQKAFPIVWNKYIEYLISKWIDKVDMMTYGAKIYKQKFWAKSYGYAFTMY